MDLFLETALLCLLYWGMCWLGTGTDDKNLSGFSSYPDGVQEIVRKNPALAGKLRQSSAVSVFFGNLLMFSILFVPLGRFLSAEGFGRNFLNVLIMGQCLNLFDFIVIDLLWWRHTKRVRFEGTKECPELYRDITKHRISFFKGIVMFAVAAVLDGAILALLHP